MMEFWRVFWGGGFGVIFPLGVVLGGKFQLRFRLQPRGKILRFFYLFLFQMEVEPEELKCSQLQSLLNLFWDTVFQL